CRPRILSEHQRREWFGKRFGNPVAVFRTDFGTPSASAQQLFYGLRAEPIVENLDMTGCHQRWMLDAAGARQCEKLFAQRENVVRESNRLRFWIQSVAEPLILGRHASRALIGMTPQRLDTADREQRLAADIDEIAAE